MALGERDPAGRNASPVPGGDPRARGLDGGREDEAKGPEIQPKQPNPSPLLAPRHKVPGVLAASLFLTYPSYAQTSEAPTGLEEAERAGV